MRARIYQPSRGATQSGQAKSRDWVLEHVPGTAREIDPLMGWTSSSDMNQQVRLRFATRDEAVAYATAQGIAFELAEPQTRAPVIRPGGYGDNFAFARKESWTH
jgi:hypothetical protein